MNDGAAVGIFVGDSDGTEVSVGNDDGLAVGDAVALI